MLGLGFLTKGPPALLPWWAMLAFDALLPRRARPSALGAPVLAAFALVALPWYAAVVLRHPGLLEHFVGREVVQRLASDSFDRNGGALGWLQVYAPTLALGTLPFTPRLLRAVPALRHRVVAWRTRGSREADRPGLLLALWIALPLAVFCLAQSRMPLYLLPLFAPLALLVARLHVDGRLPRARWLLGWLALLLSLKLAAAAWATHKDASGWARAIEACTNAPVPEVVFVDDMARYGLRIYLGAQLRVRKVSSEPIADSKYVPDWDAALVDVLPGRSPRSVWVCRTHDWPRLRRRIAAAGYRAVALGAPHRGRVIFRVERG